MPAKKRAARRGPIANPFDKSEEPNRWGVAKLLLQKGAHSWEELTDAAGGVLSTRTMGGILVELENAGARFVKFRDPEYGTCYELDPTADSIAPHTGADATGNHQPRSVNRKAPAKKSGKSVASRVSKRSPVAKKSGRIVRRRPMRFRR